MLASDDLKALFRWIDAAMDQPEGMPLRLYAILDGARDEQIVPRLRASRTGWKCLFAGTLEPELASAAPYLVELDPHELYTQTLLAQGWGKAWGIFLVSRAPLEQLHRHFRGFLRVADEDGRMLLFRYYDPRVLRVYLPTCTTTEFDQVFGPVDAFLLEATTDGPGTADGLQMQWVDGKFATTTTAFAAPHPARSHIIARPAQEVH